MLQKIFLSFLILVPWSFQDSVQETDDDFFITFSQSRNMPTLKSLVNRVVHLKNSYTGRISVLNYYSDFFERKFNEMENQLNSSEKFNSSCVLKYRSEAPELDKVATMLKQCLEISKSGYDLLTQLPVATLRSLESHYNGSFVSSLNECKIRYSPMHRSVCSLEAMHNSNARVNDYMNTFESNMMMANSEATLKIKKSFDCYADILIENLNKISKVLTLTNHCISGNKNCTQCNKNITLWDDSCPKSASLSLRANNLNNSVIENPFKGLSSKVRCLQLHFTR